jgi:hypothetical protein
MSKFGKIFFLLGAALFVACIITLPFWKNFETGLMTAVLGVLVGSAILILLGETLRFSGKKRDEKLGLTFLDYYRLRRRKSRASPGAKRNKEDGRRCAFCGIRLTPTGIPARLDGVVDLNLSESHAGHCEECGKLVCPQCAFRKGMDMGIRSFRCPSCGGRVT